MPLFGVVDQEGHGHVVTAILIAMVGMLFTGISYGRMARAFPSAGSAYTYVGQVIHPALGFVAGWSMLMDYVLNPLICTIWCSKAAMNLIPIPYPIWAIFFVALFTGMNLRKIHATARTNATLAIVMGIVIVAVLVLWPSEKILIKQFHLEMFWRILRGMGRAALRIQVVKKDQKVLKKFLSGGVQPVRAVLRGMALLHLAKGVSAPRIAEFISLTPQAIRKVGHRYAEGGLERALYEKERPGATALLEDSQKQRIIAMVCAGPPEGHARWTVRLVAQEAVKRRLVPRVGRETIRVLLLSHDLKPWREKNMVVRRDKPAWSRG